MTTQQGDDKTLSHYDPHLIPAETAARAEREGEQFGHVDHDDATKTEHIHTRDGYTIDQEGLINNYAVEPPMYINEPGDLDEVEKAVAEQRAADRKALAEDEEGKLTMTHDWRHRGPGII
jgi:hypothetical protein